MARRDATHVKRQQPATRPATPQPVTPSPSHEVTIAGVVYTTLEQATRAGVASLYLEQLLPATSEINDEEEEMEEV